MNSSVVAKCSPVRWTPLIAVALLALGCGGRVSTETWRHQLTEYTHEQAHNDPNALRHMRTADGRPGFTVLGGTGPARSTDVVGLLLGHREIRGRPWFIYLVGTVAQGELTEAHVAAAHWRGDEGFRWVLGDPQPEALETYRNHLKQRKPGWRSGEEPFAGSYTGWPREADDYELSVGPRELTVREIRSGARWTLPLRAFREPQHREAS